MTLLLSGTLTHYEGLTMTIANQSSIKRPKKQSVEDIKLQSQYLKGAIPEQLHADGGGVDEATYQLLKFSGMYQQDDRDLRKERRKEGKERAYSFMVRTKLPMGALTASQYLAHDKMADKFGNGTLRLTTRQGIQLHGILKGDIKPMLQELHENLVTSLSACGDVVRNVMACPAPEQNRKHALIRQVAEQIENHFLPRSGAYYDLWLDDKKHKIETVDSPIYGEAVDTIEPIYGKTYLPRKFKIAIAFPEDNCVDVFTQDIGIVPVLEGTTLRGFNILVGGGLGMSHTDASTKPILAKRLGFVKADDILKATEVIVSIQRDNGNRENRKLARMKYLVEAWGIEKFRAEFDTRFGQAINDWVEVGDFKLDDHLGWRAQGDGLYYYGIPIENGRIKDEGSFRLRTALRKISEDYGTELRITAQHNILVTNLKETQQNDLLELLKEHGIKTKDEISKARRYGIACPALPTCSLALAESERVFPQFIDALEQELDGLGLASEDISVRMTGCPNGCARPYSAELAFVGRSLNSYKLYLGGSFEGERLAQTYADMVKFEDLLPTVAPLLRYWKDARKDSEKFGDFCNRVGFDALRGYAKPLSEAAD